MSEFNSGQLVWCVVRPRWRFSAEVGLKEHRSLGLSVGLTNVYPSINPEPSIVRHERRSAKSAQSAVRQMMRGKR